MSHAMVILPHAESRIIDHPHLYLPYFALLCKSSGGNSKRKRIRSLACPGCERAGDLNVSLYKIRWREKENMNEPS